MEVMISLSMIRYAVILFFLVASVFQAVHDCPHDGGRVRQLLDDFGDIAVFTQFRHLRTIHYMTGPGETRGPGKRKKRLRTAFFRPKLSEITGADVPGPPRCILQNGCIQNRAERTGVFDLKSGVLSEEYIVMIIAGIIAGTTARIVTLVVDNRQTPSYPNGLFINLVTGIIASMLGAVAIPALLEKDFVAITFLTIALQHFRDIRKIEKESLEMLERTEYTKRGEAYIDGISKTYEARNYISLLASVLTVTVVAVISVNGPPVRFSIGLILGLSLALYLKRFTRGKRVGDICAVREGQFEFRGSNMFVEGIFVAGVFGTDWSRELFSNEGVVIVVEPKSQEFRITLENLGQRQAMLFEASRALGVKRFRMTRRSFETGRIIIALVPIIRDPRVIMEAVKNTPILENSRKVHRIMSGGR